MEEKEDKKNTFTKSILSVIMFLYFMGAVLGTILVVMSTVVDVKYRLQIDSQMFIAYAAYLGGPTATAIGFYAWKSKAENILKIQQSNIQAKEDASVIEILSKMGEN